MKPWGTGYAYTKKILKVVQKEANIDSATA